MVYFKWLDTWNLLDNKNDSINGEDPLSFVTGYDIIHLEHLNNFIKVQYKEKFYNIHVSNLMWVEE